jgi:hypothetical protein
MGGNLTCECGGLREYALDRCSLDSPCRHPWRCPRCGRTGFAYCPTAECDPGQMYDSVDEALAVAAGSAGHDTAGAT